MTVGQLIAATDPLKKILLCSLPVKTSFRIGKFINDVQPALTAYEDARVRLVAKLGKKQKDGTYQLAQEKRQKFADELNTLLDEKLECNTPTLKLDELDSVGVELTPTECSSLAWLIEE